MAFSLLTLVVSAATLSLSSFVAAENDWPGDIEYHFRELKARITDERGPDEIYALLSTTSNCAIERKGELATLECDDANGRTRERELDFGDFRELQEWLAANNFDQFLPFDEGTFDGTRYEYVHLDRHGTEARVPMNNPPGFMGAPAVVPDSATAAPNRDLYGLLTKRLTDLSESPAMRVRYKTIEHLPGFRLVYARETKGDVRKLEHRNGKLLALLQSEDEGPQWHEVTADGLAPKVILEPDDPLNRHQWPDYYFDDTDYVDVKAGPYSGKRIWVGQREKDATDGLWACSPHTKPELIARGRFARLVVTPEGDWLITAKAAEGKMWDVPNTVVRIHLAKKAVDPVDLPAADTFEPIRWIPAHQRVLVFQEREDGRSGRAGSKEREYYLANAATGSCEKLTGEFRPLTDYNNLPRHLQAASEPDVFWATIVEEKPRHPDTGDTRLGKYSTSNFTFTPVLDLPGVRVEADDFFVDESTATAWLTLTGDIIQLQLE